MTIALYTPFGYVACGALGLQCLTCAWATGIYSGMKEKLKTAEEIQDYLKGHLSCGDERKKYNSDQWQVSKVLAQEIRRAYQMGVADTKAKSKSSGGNEKRILGEEERIQELTAYFDGKLLDGTLMPQDIAQYKDILSLKVSERDVTVEIIDFSDVFPDEASALEMARRATVGEIMEANR